MESHCLSFHRGISMLNVKCSITFLLRHSRLLLIYMGILSNVIFVLYYKHGRLETINGL